ncbi:MAG: putative hydrolase of the superfamily [Methanofollis sp.]|nr:putative hydrolase of the superfamily [Methanofollis sp.]
MGILFDGVSSMGILDGVQAVFFDCYNTLIDISTDEDNPLTWQMVSSWLSYQGVGIGARDLMHEYRRICHEQAMQRRELYPEIDVEQVFAEICRDHRLWEIDARKVGRRAARTFRAASVRKKRVFPESLRLLEHFRGLPMGLVSNGQRVFSEHELRHLGLSKYFDVLVFSSDLGFKKPDPRIFRHALSKLAVDPENALFIGDSYRDDILASREIGMRSMFIRDAWALPDRA